MDVPVLRLMAAIPSAMDFASSVAAIITSTVSSPTPHRFRRSQGADSEAIALADPPAAYPPGTTIPARDPEVNSSANLSLLSNSSLFATTTWPCFPAEPMCYMWPLMAKPDHCSGPAPPAVGATERWLVLPSTQGTAWNEHDKARTS